MTSDLVLQWARQGIAPTPDLTISEWSDLHRILPRKSSAEPGRWRTARTPYLREIMDCLGPQSPVSHIVVMKGTQLGLTEAGNNWFGYTVAHDPGPMMMVFPTIDVARRHGRQKLDPTIAETPILREMIPPARERDSGNTALAKEFPGGMIVLAGANSAAGLRSVSIKKLMLDEVDAYDTDLESEGDPCALAENRTDAFPDRKIYKISTPTIKGASRIEQFYLESDRRHYHVPCPHCGGMQWLQWSRIRYEVESHRVRGEAWYECEHCEGRIDEHAKTQMLEAGQWIPEDTTCPARGYHLSSLYSPVGWLSWTKIAQEHEAGQRTRDVTLLKRWTNTRLADTWDEADEPIVSESELMARREAYPAPVPMGALVLVAAVDVQDDRLEVAIKGIGPHRESWLIDYKILHGCPADEHLWAMLDAYLSQPWQHESGAEIRVSLAAIDTGGHYTQQVYDYARPRQSRPVARIAAIKGSSDYGTPLVSKATRQKKGQIVLHWVGVVSGKDVVFASLRGGLRDPQPDPSTYETLQADPYPTRPLSMHFPLGHELVDEEYFRQLTAERVDIVKVNRTRVRRYVPVGARRNEALDLEVYCQWAAEKLRVKNWGTRARQLSQAPRFVPAEDPGDSPPPPPKPRVAQREPYRVVTERRRGWARTW